MDALQNFKDTYDGITNDVNTDAHIEAAFWKMVTKNDGNKASVREALSIIETERPELAKRLLNEY